MLKYFRNNPSAVTLSSYIPKSKARTDFHMEIGSFLCTNEEFCDTIRKNAEVSFMNILVTGAKGFVGKNLVENLKNIRDG